jgi:hypothetical protein
MPNVDFRLPPQNRFQFHELINSVLLSSSALYTFGLFSGLVEYEECYVLFTLKLNRARQCSMPHCNLFSQSRLIARKRKQSNFKHITLTEWKKTIIGVCLKSLDFWSIKFSISLLRENFFRFSLLCACDNINNLGQCS